MIAEIHVAPSPSGTDGELYAHIEAAIAVVEASGLRYQVGALGTTFEGEPDRVWQTLRAAHEACLASGADRTITSIRLAEWAAADGDDREFPTIDSLTSRFRAADSTSD